MKIMMVAGEASGDMNGSHLAREITRREPRARLFGMGGKLMQKAGVKLLFNPTSISTIGFVEAVRSVGVLRRVLGRFAGVLDRQSPDVVVLIDFPEFNMRLGEMAKERGIPVVYYFSPSAWAWRKGRAKKVAEHATAVLAVFPFEAEVYREAGAPVEYVGHPLVDVVKSDLDRQSAREAFGCERAEPVVALLPGSRRQEIDNLLGPMLQGAKRFAGAHPRVKYLLPLAHTVDPARVRAKVPERLPLEIVEGRTYDVLRASDFAVAAMGTVTLEAALMGTPMVGLYRVAPSTAWIIRRLYTGRHFALPNIVAGREVVRELLQDDVTPERIAECMEELLSGERTRTILEGYEEVRARLGGPGAVGRAAEAVLRIARSREGARGAERGGAGGAASVEGGVPDAPER